MAAFCGPALLVPMADPLMGFSDVVCVGQFASTAELSALGPATLALSFATYAFQAVQVATLALVSERLRARDQPAAQRALSTALWVALALGSLLALPLVVSPNAASAVVGATGCDLALRPLAETYVRIRAAGLPFVLATMVAQAALLAQRDSRTPACAVALGVGVNVLGNLVAVAWLGLGLAGAAGTTVLTQAAGALSLAALMWRQRRAGESAVAGLFRGSSRRRRGGGGGESDDSDSSDEEETSENDDPLSPPMPPLRPVPRPPTAADAAALGRTVGPLSVAYVCRNLCYLALQGAAASLDVTRLAAHQATFSCWNILSFVSSPVEQSALAFVPAAAAQAAAEEEEEETERRRKQQQQEEKKAPEDAQPAQPSSSSSSSSWWRVDATVRLVLLCGLGMGLGCGALAAAVPSLAPFLFTPDSSVWPWMRSIAPQAFLSMVLIGVDVSCAGCLLAGRDLAYVARSYVVTLCVLWGAVLGPLKLASSLGGVWWCLVLFFAARAAQSTARLGWLMRTKGLVSRLSAA
jgi:Na+-driven multidrug efflux pump